MGDARKRGSREERVAQAIERKRQERLQRAEAERLWRENEMALQRKREERERKRSEEVAKLAAERGEPAPALERPPSRRPRIHLGNGAMMAALAVAAMMSSPMGQTGGFRPLPGRHPEDLDDEGL